jgi:hypothetical protein
MVWSPGNSIGRYFYPVRPVYGAPIGLSARRTVASCEGLDDEAQRGGAALMRALMYIPMYAIYVISYT